MATAISNRNLLAGAGEGRLKWASVIIIKPVGSQCRSWPSPAVSGISARRRRTRPAAQPARYRCASKPHPLQFVIRQGSTVRLLLLYFLSDNNLYNNDIIPREVLLIMAIVANGLLHQRVLITSDLTKKYVQCTLSKVSLKVDISVCLCGEKNALHLYCVIRIALSKVKE